MIIANNKNEFEIINFMKSRNILILFTKIRNRTSHFHTAQEFSLLIEGESEYSLNNVISNSYTLNEGDLLLINQNQEHAFKSISSQDSIFLILQISPRFYEENFPHKKNIYWDTQYLNSNNFEEKIETVNILLKELAYQYFNSDYFNFKQMALLNLLLDFLSNNIDNRILKDHELQYSNYINSRLIRLENYVESNFNKNITLSKFAELEGISLSHASRMIKNTIGINFNTYLRRVRVSEVKRMINQRTFNITELCLQSGFSDPRILKKAFLELEKISLEEYIGKVKSRNLKDFNYNLPSEYILNNSESKHLSQKLRPSEKELKKILNNFIC